MGRKALTVCVLFITGGLVCADDVPPAVLRPAEPFAIEQAFPPADQKTNLLPAESFNYPKSEFPTTTVEQGLFLDGNLGVVFPNIRGARALPQQYQPIARWRVPELNAADLDGVSGSTSNTFSELRLAAGYRFADGWGEIITAFTWGSGLRERWFANGDPRALWYFQGVIANQQDSYDDTRSSTGSTQPDYSSIEPGKSDPLGLSHLSSKVNVAMFDLAYGNGLYESRQVGLRFTAGGRWGSISVDDINEGVGTNARENSRFVGFGPMASLYGELMFFGTEPSDDISVGIFGQGTGSILFGNGRQIDREEFTYPNTPSYRYYRADKSQSVPVFGFELGLVGRGVGTGPAMMLGYQFEEWKHPASVGGSRFDLTTHGIFVRCTWNY